VFARGRACPYFNFLRAGFLHAKNPPNSKSNKMNRGGRNVLRGAAKYPSNSFPAVLAFELH
jgi:hypothetical protein